MKEVTMNELLPIIPLIAKADFAKVKPRIVRAYQEN
jgi:hypothetical protein